MKSVSLLAACALFAASALAQGTVNFANFVSGKLDAPVKDEKGGLAAGADYLAQLYAGTAAGSLAAVGTAAAFRTGTGAGYWRSVTSLAIPGIAGDAKAFIQVKAWKGAQYATYDAAMAAGQPVGVSDPFEVVLGGGGSPPTLPATLAGLKSFAIIPEPSTMALGLLGAAVLLFRRRN